jgi:hypothetical protein
VLCVARATILFTAVLASKKRSTKIGHLLLSLSRL